MAYHLLKENEIEKIKRVSDITGGDYELNENLITAENLMAAIEDLLVEVGRLEERYNDLEEELRENYRPISIAEQYGISERDFY